ncbi:MAG TPA: hypothetical protein PLY70_11005 [Saprospiraceae bacterium]|nr:hypothetical protein [Saprospiraceae bacterium]HPN70329.1 hypothetical protein [Saprospiraceae bacterium]
MIRELIALEPTAKVWIYVSDRFFSEEETEEIRADLYQFLESWTSHSQQLLTYGNLFHHRFLVIFVDDKYAGASGCSIDTSVRFLTSLGQKYHADFFDRSKVHVLIDNQVVEHKFSDIKKLVTAGIINKDTLVFDHTVADKNGFIKKWILPMEETWFKKFL